MSEFNLYKTFLVLCLFCSQLLIFFHSYLNVSNVNVSFFLPVLKIEPKEYWAISSYVFVCLFVCFMRQADFETPPALASQVAGIIGICYHTQLQFFLSRINILWEGTVRKWRENNFEVRKFCYLLPKWKCIISLSFNFLIFKMETELSTSCSYHKG